MAKIEAGRYALSPDALDLAEIFDATTRLVQRQLEAKALRLEVSAPALSSPLMARSARAQADCAQPVEQRDQVHAVRRARSRRSLRERNDGDDRCQRQWRRDSEAALGRLGSPVRAGPRRPFMSPKKGRGLALPSCGRWRGFTAATSRSRAARAKGRRCALFCRARRRRSSHTNRAPSGACSCAWRVRCGRSSGCEPRPVHRRSSAYGSTRRRARARHRTRRPCRRRPGSHRRGS